MLPLNDTTQLSHQLSSLTLETCINAKQPALNSYNDRFIPNRRATNLETVDLLQTGIITPTSNQLSTLVSLY